MSLTVAQSEDIRATGDGRCNIKRPDRPRCAGIATELHHIKPRSHGGKDTPDNIVEICSDCHRAIHNQEWDGPFKDDDGRWHYTKDIAGPDAIEKVSIYFWQDVGGTLEADALSHHDSVQACLRVIGAEMLKTGCLLAQMEDRGLFDVLGYESLAEYALACGQRHPGRFQAAARVGRLYLDAHPEAQAMILEVDYSILRDSLPTLRRLKGGELEEELGTIIDMRSKGIPTNLVAEAVKEAHSTGSVTEWRVTFSFPEQHPKVTVEVDAPSADQAGKRARKMLGPMINATAAFKRI